MKPEVNAGHMGPHGTLPLTQNPMGMQAQEMEELLRQASASKPLRRGDLVEGEVMRVDPDGVLVNIGQKAEGVIPQREMRSLSQEGLLKLQAGDEVFAYVLRPEGEEGPALLSLDRARGERGWQVLQRHLDNGRTLQGVIRGVNRGGAVVEVEGIQGFVPLSQLAPVARRPGQDNAQDVLAQRIGETVEVRLLELNRHRNRIILSERQVLQEKREQQKELLVQQLLEGEVKKGRVTSVCSFGAFVDLGGADGLIHISELSWSPVQSPEEVVHVGEELEVYVLKVDRDARKIALSLRRMQREPWETIADRYQMGQLVSGTITKLATFGAFARVEGAVEGLVHISELTDRVIKHPREVVKEGDVVTLKVLKVEPERRRLSLSLKQAAEEMGAEPTGFSEEVPTRAVREQRHVEQI
ncbi:MAG: S1 RNA-binding domain-containing protein [Chloroflexi bacterium]|nr:S1 RNA-binding domain-containing protein [Chloroflexota bacterium]